MQKFQKTLYNMHFNELNKGYNLKWINSIKNVLVSAGRVDLLYETTINNPRATKLRITQTLKDQLIKTWNSRLLDSSKCRNDALFKNNIEIEKNSLDLTHTIYLPILKFRTSNNKLPVEKGRWENIPLQDRKCNLCPKNDVGDEFHYLLTCPFFEAGRKIHIKPYYNVRPNVIKFKALLQSCNKKILIELSKFLKVIMDNFQNSYMHISIGKRIFSCSTACCLVT